MRPEDEEGWREFRRLEKGYKGCPSPFTQYEHCIPEQTKDGVKCKHCGRPMVLTERKKMTDLVVQDSPRAIATYQQPNLFDLAPQQMVQAAASMATVLADVIEKQRLFTLIQGKKHVRAEGWATLGSMLGFLPRERDVKELPDGSYEATVELYSLRDNRVVGQASAICGIDEKRWANAERYARRSMAVTRATGKAYRLGFAWVMALAGYEGTPAEEMYYDGDYREPNRQRPSANRTQSQPAAAKVDVFDEKAEGHLDRLGKVVGDRVSEPKDQARLVQLMQGRPMTKTSVDEAIRILEVEKSIEESGL